MRAGLHRHLELMYADCPVCGPASLAAAKSINKQVFIDAVRHIHGKKGYSSDMLGHGPVKALLYEVNAALDASLGKVETVIPEELLRKLRSDVFVFSGCKTELQLREASAMLVDEFGKPVEWNAFKNAVLEVHKRYNINYLEAEYNFATQSAEMAARWADQATDGDRYNLQYRIAGDDRVRDSHVSLNRTTLPPSDPFWDSYYPPNGWRCRCTAVQVLKDKYPASDPAKAAEQGKKATTQIDKNGANRLEMFRFNPGKQAVIFPPHHPYFKIREDVERQLHATGETVATVPTKAGKLEVSSLHGKNEKAENIEVAEHFANTYGHHIKLLASGFNTKTADAYNYTTGQNLEFKTNGKPSKNAVDLAIREAAKKADHIVLNVKSDISDTALAEALNDRVKREPNIQSVTILRKGKDKIYLRKAIVDDGFEI